MAEDELTAEQLVTFAANQARLHLVAEYLASLIDIVLSDPTAILASVAEKIATLVDALTPLALDEATRLAAIAAHEAAIAAVGTSQPWPRSTFRRVEPAAGKRLVAALQALRPALDPADAP